MSWTAITQTSPHGNMHVTLHRGSEQISEAMMTAECDFVHPLVQAVRWGSARAYAFSIDIVNLIATETERLTGKGPLAVSYLNEVEQSFSSTRQLFVGIPLTKLFSRDSLRHKSIMTFLDITGELKSLGLVFFAFDETLIVWSDGRRKIQASELACAKVLMSCTMLVWSHPTMSRTKTITIM